MKKCGQGTQYSSIHVSQIFCWKWLYYFIASCVRASRLTTIKRHLHITVPSTAVVNTEESSKKSSWKKNLLIFVEIVKNPNSGFFQVCEVLIPWGGSLLDLVHNMWILLIKPPYKFYIRPFFVRATLDEGSRSMVQWHRAILLDESHKLDLWLLDECPRPKSDKSSLNLHGSILEGNSVGSDQEKEVKRKAHDSKYQDAS